MAKSAWTTLLAMGCLPNAGCKGCRTAAPVANAAGSPAPLVDRLLDAGYRRPAVLDVSASALGHAQRRLGPRHSLADWIVGDVTRAALAARSVHSGGHVVLATFAPDGPEKCSGLPVQRHDGASASRLLGTDFQLAEEDRELHLTPGGSEQHFAWMVFRRR